MKNREKTTLVNDFTFAHCDEGFDNHIDHSIRHYSSLHDDRKDVKILRRRRDCGR
jgi:hypothetical protein